MFHRHFVPGEYVFLYTAGCSGLGVLARSLQLPIFKYGLSQQSDLLVRQQQLRVDRYGGCFKNGSRYPAMEGFDDWELRRCEVSKNGSGGLVTVMPRALQIQLPKSLSCKKFDKLLQKVLSPIALHEWVNSPDGREHLAALGVNPSIASRYTAYQFGTSTRYSRASELYISRRGDLDRIVALIIEIIRRHVVGQPIVTSRCSVST